MKTLLFDFDGTIADSFELMVEIAHNIIGLPKTSDDEIERLRAMPLSKVIREMHIPILKIPKLIVQGRQQMRARITELHPFEGMSEALTALHARGFNMYVLSSNGPEGVTEFLKNHKLDHLFHEVHGNVALFSKAAALHKIMKQNQLQKKDCFYIGDEVRDITAAAQAGVRCVTVTWGYQAAATLRARKSFAVAETPADLVNIFQKMMTP